MKIAVEFPSIVYRDGPEGVARLARAVEDVGYDQLDVFDHVVMGHPLPDRPAGPYPPRMPILEALTTLAYCAAVTRRIGLGTEVLVLPQRHPTLVAKQVATLDTLSGGRVRLGVGVGWQHSEYDALGVSFRERGARMDEAIGLLRRYWSEDPVDAPGPHYPVTAIAMEPKPPQGARLPIWIGGSTEAALRRAGRLGDGWLAARAALDLDRARADIATVRRFAEEAGRDPAVLGFQSQLAPPGRGGEAPAATFWSDPAQVSAVASRVREAGFDAVTVNATGVFQAGARSLEAMIDKLGAVHEAIRREVG